jgi:lipopolysaccharide/colanic/teichoic acid biosynthesis glycosyltransferase
MGTRVRVSDVEHAFVTPAAGSSRPFGTATVKRLFDLAVAASLLVVLSPSLAIVALAVRLESSGPVLYRCRRAGFHGRTFDMLKFRKMRHDASGPPLTTADDVRFTRLGKFLAASKLDEMPQLWNVVKGDMSLVGPRPEDLVFVAREPIAYSQILQVRPGITGLSQLAFSRESRLLQREDGLTYYVEHLFPAKIQLDQLYVLRGSILMDIHILLWTFAATLSHCDISVNRQTAQISLRRRAGSSVQFQASPTRLPDRIATSAEEKVN